MEANRDRQPVPAQHCTCPINLVRGVARGRRRRCRSPAG